MVSYSINVRLLFLVFGDGIFSASPILSDFMVHLQQYCACRIPSVLIMVNFSHVVSGWLHQDTATIRVSRVGRRRSMCTFGGEGHKDSMHVVLHLHCTEEHLTVTII